MAAHIPAWKRLGLKLKYASESAPTSHDQPQANGSSQKRKADTRESGVEHHTPEPKRTRLNESSSKVPAPVVSTPQAKHVVQIKRKKSVSFTPDTKPSDGDTNQTIPLITPNSPGSTPAKPKPKKEKKPKSERKAAAAATAAATPRKSRDALDYLSQHFHARSTWKFNKNREIWILKHALSTSDIPKEHNASLANYVHGLKSAGARERLATDCRTALAKDNTHEAEDEDLKTRVIDHLNDDSLQTATEEDGTFTEQIKDQHRARIVLWSLGMEEKIRGRVVNGSVNGTQPSKVKKSKARTSRIEVESSSSDDSSSSSESDSEDESSSSGTSSDSDATSSSGSSSDSDTASQPHSGGSSDSNSDSDGDSG